jgi:hypothetical protein
MNAFRHFLPVFTLFIAVFAPQATAMSLLPRARQVAAMVMNPSVRTTLTQAGKTGAQELTSAIAPQAERRLMTFTQSNAQSASHQISNVAKPNTGSTLAQKCALGIGGAGLTYAIDNDAVVHATDGTYLSLFSKLWAAMVGTAVVKAITYAEQDFPTIQTFLERVAQNPEYARELAEQVTQENIFDLKPDLLTEIVKIYPEAKERFAAYLTSNTAQCLKGLTDSWDWCVPLCIELMRNNPQAAALLRAFTVAHFEKIVQGNGCKFIEKMVKNDRASAQLLTASAIEHFVILMERAWGEDVIDAIMVHNRESVSLMTGLAVKHFAQVAAKGYHGYRAIKSIIEHNPQSLTLFAACVVEHFEALEKTSEGQGFIERFKWIIGSSKRNAVSCTPTVVENIALLASSERGVALIERVMDNNPQSIPLLAESAVKNFDALMATHKGANLIAKISLLSASKTITLLDTCIAQHAESFIANPNGLALLVAVIITDTRHPELLALIVPVAIKHIATLLDNEIGLRLLAKVMQQDPTIKREVQKALNESGDQNDGSKPLAFQKRILHNALRYKKMTPTELGALHNGFHYRYGYLWGEESILNVVKNVIAIEREYQDTHYTFVHGRNFAYNLREMVYRNLWEYAHNTKVPADFRFTHTKPEHDPLTKDVLVVPEEKKLHERNIAVLENHQSDELRNRRLFLNTELFGNSGAVGSSSFSYFSSNDNASGFIRVSIDDIFEQFGQKKLYEKYKKRFEALDLEHRALTKYGELLIVAVPKERVSEDVQTIQVSGDPAGVKTLDALQARETNPSFKDNELNFTLAMTDTAALDPKSGIKVRSVHAVNPAKYAAWQAKYDALMRELESEFRRNWKQSVKAKERGHQELLDVVSKIKKSDTPQQKTNEQTNAGMYSSYEETDAGMYSA